MKVEEKNRIEARKAVRAIVLNIDSENPNINVSSAEYEEALIKKVERWENKIYTAHKDNWAGYRAQANKEASELRINGVCRIWGITREEHDELNSPYMPFGFVFEAMKNPDHPRTKRLIAKAEEISGLIGGRKCMRMKREKDDL